MPDKIFIQGHEFVKRDIDGLYASIDMFIMNNIEDWLTDDINAGKVLLLEKVDGGLHPLLVSLSRDTFDALIKEKENNQSLYLWAAIGAPCGDMVGYIE